MEYNLLKSERIKIELQLYIILVNTSYLFPVIRQLCF